MDWATAYCAPGRKLAAALALMMQGEQAAEIVEHAWLAGDDRVILVREPVLEWPVVPPGAAYTLTDSFDIQFGAAPPAAEPES